VRTFPPSSVASLACAALLLAAAGSARAADTDGDGVDDSADNCRRLANRLQLDSDGDGFGNRCDVDFDQSGLADGRDVRFFTHKIRSGDPGADIDENGIVDWNDAVASIGLWGLPPGPGALPADDDGDGVPLLSDACEDSVGPSGVVRPGCSQTDLARDAARLIAAPAAREIRAVFSEVESLPPEYDALVAELETTASLFETAGRLMEGGSICSASNVAGRAADGLASLRSTLEGLLAYTAGEIGRSWDRPGGTPGVDWEDADEFASAMLPYWMSERSFDRGVEAGVRAADEMRAVCDAVVGEDSITDDVAEFDESTRTLTLASGRRLGVVAGLEVGLDPDGSEVSLSPGLAVTAYGTSFDDGTLLVDEVSPLDDLAVVAFQERSCLRLQIAPYQLDRKFTDYAPAEVHDARGYLATGSTELSLERGMGLAVSDAECPPADDPFVYEAVYGGALRLTVDGDTTTLALFLEGGVIAIPAWVPDFATVEIELITRRKDCLRTNPDACTATRTLGTDRWTGVLRPRGYYCAAGYEETHFALEYAAPTEFAITRPSFLTVVSGPGRDNPTSEFVALGWRVRNGTHGSEVEAVRRGDDFAVFRGDFRDAWDELPNWTGDTNTVLGLSDDPGGVIERPGLIWPSVRGVQNGAPFRFACRLPRVSRDVVGFCTGQDDAFYTMPLEVNGIGQGPNGSFSHTNSEAWDIAAPVGTWVRASRGGKVMFSRDTEADTCDPTIHDVEDPLCAGNGVVIRHSDGIDTTYWHFDQGGSNVVEGSRVGRGALIGLSGNTGYSTGPHVHLEANRGESRVDVWFRAGRLFGGGEPIEELSCYEPKTGDLLTRFVP